MPLDIREVPKDEVYAKHSAKADDLFLGLDYPRILWISLISLGCLVAMVSLKRLYQCLLYNNGNKKVKKSH